MRRSSLDRCTLQPSARLEHVGPGSSDARPGLVILISGIITVSAVAARLGVSAASVYKLCQRGELRGLRIGGALRFQPSAIDEYLDRSGLL
jgi:excisionase family DNA binding protein